LQTPVKKTYTLVHGIPCHAHRREVIKITTSKKPADGLYNGLLYGVLTTTSITAALLFGIAGGPLVLMPALVLVVTGPVCFGIYRANQRDRELPPEEQAKPHAKRQYPEITLHYKKRFMVGTLAACTASALFNYAVLLPALTPKTDAPKTQTSTPIAQNQKTAGAGGVYRL
jgi:hypothetical protein